MKPGARAAIAVAAVFVFGAPAYDAKAADSITVSSQGCTLDGGELDRLVRLELESVIDAKGGESAYTVEIRCADGAIVIRLHDPLTNKTLERSVLPPPPAQPEPERLIALTVAQLYRAAWLELATDDRPPLPPSKPAPRSENEVASAKHIAKRRLGTEVHHDPAWSVALAGGPRARRLQAPTLLPNLELDAAVAPTGKVWWLLVSGGAEWASLSRTAGDVDVVLVRAAAGLGLEPLTSGIWSGFAEVTGGVTYARISGHDVSAGYHAGRVEGAGFDAALGLGPAVRLGSVRIELLGHAGVLVGTPAGRVFGDHEVSLDGPWAGGDSRLRWMF